MKALILIADRIRGNRSHPVPGGLFLAVLLLALSGCLPTHSLYPVYTDNTIVFEQQLVGTWVGEESESSHFDKGSWTFTSWEDRTYRLAHQDDDGETGVFSAHLVKTGQYHYLDLFPEEGQVKGSNLTTYHLLPVHTIVRVTFRPDSVYLETLDADWLGAYLEANPEAIGHKVLTGALDDLVLLTAEPEAIQTFLMAHENDEEAYAMMVNLVRDPHETEPPEKQHEQ